MGTGKNPSQHKGGRGEHLSKLKPGYPTGTPEQQASTTEAPKYPRSNFAGRKNANG